MKSPSALCFNALGELDDYPHPDTVLYEVWRLTE
jgi:hypothetical protein